MLHYNLNFLIASTVFAGLTLFGLFNVLLYLRKKFPVRVNCWFCNTNLRVPYAEWNSFTCPKCQQYNGFSEDGGYNKEIIEQHYSKYNSNQFCQRPFTQRHTASNNGFCEFCSRNQELKIHQLANFRPRVEEKYDEEVEEFRQKLEDSYQLCHMCQSHLNKTLNKVKTKFIGSKLSQLSAKLNKSLHRTATIIIDEGKILSYFITLIILTLSIANFIRDMKVELPPITNDERILNIYNHFLVFLYTLLDIMTSWLQEMKFNDLTADIDKIATSALVLNLILTYMSFKKKIRLPVIISMLLWSAKMMMNEIPIDASRELSLKGLMAVILIVSSMTLFKSEKKDELNATHNTSLHRLETESFEESDTEDFSETSSFFDHRSNRTVFSKSSRLNSSYRTTLIEPVKSFNSTLVPNLTKPIDALSDKTFSIRKEVLTADRNQVQNDINRLQLSEKSIEALSTSSTIKDFNSSQYINPFSLDRSRCDSPAPSVASLFSTSTRTNLISPPRLHNPSIYSSSSNQSWIAGGYWESPKKNYLNGVMNQTKPVISRSSSQSSGVGTIEDSDKNSREDSMSHDETTSVFSEAVNNPRRNLFEMPQNRSLFTNDQFFSQPKSRNFFNNTYSNNNSFRKYRESNTFFK